MSPEQPAPETDDEGVIAARLRSARREPRPAFADELRHRLRAAAPAVPARPSTVAHRVAALAGAGALLLVIAAIASLT